MAERKTDKKSENLKKVLEGNGRVLPNNFEAETSGAWLCFN